MKIELENREGCNIMRTNQWRKIWKHFLVYNGESLDTSSIHRTTKPHGSWCTIDFIEMTFDIWVHHI